MPILPVIPGSVPGNPSTPSGCTTTLQSVVNYARSYKELTPVLETGGWSQEPALSIANDVMQKFIAQNMDWKWNRSNIPPFLTVALQQDYVTNTTNLSWLEQGWRVDINNTSIPQPVFGMETVRDLARTSYQANPFNISWVPNRLAIFGTWMPNTSYPSGLGQTQTPASPIQQFIDVNGNFLYVVVNGVSGNVQPSCPAASPAGTTVMDGTVTWAVADPNGVAIRLAPMPATSGIVWQIAPVYQKKPPVLTSLNQTLCPIPDEMVYLFRQGFIAMCYQHAGSRQASSAYQQWEEALMVALRSADREREDAAFYPSESMTGGSVYKYGMPVGPAWPFFYDGGY